MAIIKHTYRALKNLGYSDTEVLVREATANDKGDPPLEILAEIARRTYQPEPFMELIPMLDRRLNDRTRQWRHVYRSLYLVLYILWEGSPAAVDYFHQNLYLVKTLREFQYTDDAGVDQGKMVRDKAHEITRLLQSDEALRRARNGRRNVQPMRSPSSLSSSSSVDEPDWPVTPPADWQAERDAARRREQAARDAAARKAAEDEANRMARALEDRHKSAEEEARALAAQRETEESQRRALAGEEARVRAEKQAQDELQAHQLEVARWQVEQNAMKNSMMYGQYGVWPQYTDMYMQPQMTAFAQPPMQLMQPQITGWPAPQTTGSVDFMPGSNNPFAASQPFGSGLGSNNPFTSGTNGGTSPARESSTSISPPLMQENTSQQSSASSSSFLDRTTTPGTTQLPRANSQRLDSKYLNRLDYLLAQGDGVDTFGNIGNQRLGHYASNRDQLFVHGRAQSASAASPFA